MSLNFLCTSMIHSTRKAREVSLTSVGSCTRLKKSIGTIEVTSYKRILLKMVVATSATQWTSLMSILSAKESSLENYFLWARRRSRTTSEIEAGATSVDELLAKALSSERSSLRALPELLESPSSRIVVIPVGMLLPSNSSLTFSRSLSLSSQFASSLKGNYYVD